jgi:hypothetical protein
LLDVLIVEDLEDKATATGAWKSHMKDATFKTFVNFLIKFDDVSAAASSAS